MTQFISFKALAAIIVLFFFGLHIIGVDLTQENGVIENTETVILMLAVLVFAMQISKILKSRSTQADDATLAFSLFLICLPLIGVAREVSFGRELGFSPEAVTATKRIVGGIAAVFIGLSVFVWVAKVRNRSRFLWEFLKGPTCRYLYLAILIFAASSSFEKGTFGFPKSVFLEEIFEVVAFLLILRAALYIAPSAPRA